MQITVQKMTKSEAEAKGIFSLPIWEKEVSAFDWEYSDRESCYILEGAATVSTDTEEVSFEAGDFVVFPENLKCHWKITKDIRKHYVFG